MRTASKSFPTLFCILDQRSVDDRRFAHSINCERVQRRTGFSGQESAGHSGAAFFEQAGVVLSLGFEWFVHVRIVVRTK